MYEVLYANHWDAFFIYAFIPHLDIRRKYSTMATPTSFGTEESPNRRVSFSFLVSLIFFVLKHDFTMECKQHGCRSGEEQ